jgi:hypothetical protein
MSRAAWKVDGGSDEVYRFLDHDSTDFSVGW